MATYSPISYFESLTWVETCAFSRTVERLQKEKPSAGND